MRLPLSRAPAANVGLGAHHVNINLTGLTTRDRLTARPVQTDGWGTGSPGPRTNGAADADRHDGPQHAAVRPGRRRRAKSGSGRGGLDRLLGPALQHPPELADGARGREP